MLNLLDKINSIEIINSNRISKEDQMFCEDLQKHYDAAIEFIHKTQRLYTELTGIDLNVDRMYNQKSNNKFIDWYKWECIKENEEKVKNSFISEVINYFNETYKVTASSLEFRDKYTSNVKYNDILDEIFLQLDGCSFEEKAINEIKEQTRKIYYYNDYRKTENIIIKNNKVNIDNNFAHFCSIWKEYKLSYDNNKLKAIFTSLYHFDKNKINNNTELHNRFCSYQNERRNDNYDKYETLELDKVKSIKFFKNGKLEIEFLNSEEAKEFAKEYLGI